MKTLILILLSFSLIPERSDAQTNQSAAPDSIWFEKTVYNYGTIPYQSNGECEFKFINKGKVALVLSNVNSSCGCTTPDWTKSPVKPNESGIVKVKYNTAIIGHFSKTITVYSNAANSPVVLQITGEVKQN